MGVRDKIYLIRSLFGNSSGPSMSYYPVYDYYHAYIYDASGSYVLDPYHHMSYDYSYGYVYDYYHDVLYDPSYGYMTD